MSGGESSQEIFTSEETADQTQQDSSDQKEQETAADQKEQE